MIKIYTKEEYDAQKDVIKAMPRKELEEYLDIIARCWLPDYNFNGKQEDFNIYKLHMVINEIIERLEADKHLIEGLGKSIKSYDDICYFLDQL